MTKTLNSKIENTHPGEILREEFIFFKGIENDILTRKILHYFSPTILENLLQEKIPITLVIAQGLSLALGTSVEFWLNSQESYDTHRHNQIMSTFECKSDLLEE